MFRSRPEQLAHHLRDQILHGQVAEPLPSTRDWAKQLGVGRHTLATALKMLVQEELLIPQGNQGFRLPPLPSKHDASAPRNAMRSITYWPDWRTLHTGGTGSSPLLAQWLRPHGIEHRSERWLDADFRRFEKRPAARPDHRHELFFFASLPDSHQRLIARANIPCVLGNAPVRGVDLPYLTCDWAGAIRHATFYLARRGFKRITLWARHSEAPHIANYCATFLNACREAPHGPIETEVFRPQLDVPSQSQAAHRTASRIKDRTGIIVVGPLAVSVLMTVLLRCGVRIPEQVEIAYVNTDPAQLAVVPVPVYYPYPVETIVKLIARAAIQYFETGERPRIRKLIPVEMVVPPKFG